MAIATQYTTDVPLKLHIVPSPYDAARLGQAQEGSVCVKSGLISWGCCCNSYSDVREWQGIILVPMSQMARIRYFHQGQNDIKYQ